MKDKNTHCSGCGRPHENKTLQNRQNLSKQNLRSELKAGDKIRLNHELGMLDAGDVGIVEKIEDDGKVAVVTFKPHKPFSLNRLEEHNSLSISGGPIKRLNIDRIQETTELQETRIHRTSPKYSGHTPPEVTIYSKVWEFDEVKE